MAETETTPCGCPSPEGAQTHLLRLLLAINATMFFVEAIAGFVGDSVGLLGDSLDMLADAAVYGIALYAVGRSATTKARAAYASGVFQVALALGVAIEVVRRFALGSEPVSQIMIAVGALALLANVTCLGLLAKHRRGEVHMRASWIFSRNDVVVDLGVIAGGIAVAVLGSPLPDLVIGAAVSLFVLRGGLRIVRDARAELERGGGEEALAE